MDRKLANIPERMLVRCRMIRAEQLARRVLHQIDRRKRMCARRLARTNQRQVRALVTGIEMRR